jgi:hypothetical protein
VVTRRLEFTAPKAEMRNRCGVHAHCICRRVSSCSVGLLNELAFHEKVIEAKPFIPRLALRSSAPVRVLRVSVAVQRT